MVQVDFGASLASRRFAVMAGLDPELDEMKHTFDGLPDFLVRRPHVNEVGFSTLSDDRPGALHIQTGIAREEMATFAHINECTVVYFPQLGYLLAIPRDSLADKPPSLPGLEFQVSG
jgi:DNA mismatch repair protein MSH5